MPTGLLMAAYLVAGMMFVLSIGGLSKQDTAKRGTLYGIIGMTVAVAATLLSGITNFAWLIPMMFAGVLIGAVLALRVQMTSMPEMVAILNSFGGLAAVLIGLASYVDHGPKAHDIVHQVEILLGVFIGSVTFAGSVVAFGKLRGSIGSRPVLLPGRHLVNAIMLIACVWPLGVHFVAANGMDGLTALIILTAISFVLGVHLVMAIGGADMPVVVSMLNSYSGWAAAASGFMLNNDLLIITGALVGSSGAILSYIMCRAMNRSLANVIFGGFGTSAGATPAGGEEQGTVTE
ncbi:MAG TPA: NAD(P)(+) transhydrogenase (Re/Si-specific) subunit beta, partial [Verrucomicrobiota bacterium]|nr:NAD(P)(+) transhydrogenase (Re/Si-specific) subunit beta [Verrucomicrobiota bacterium]